MGEYMDNDKCKTCRFKGLLGEHEIYCDYLYIAGHRRGCEPGEKCTVWEPDDGRKASWNKNVRRRKKKC